MRLAPISAICFVVVFFVFLVLFLVAKLKRGEKSKSFDQCYSWSKWLSLGFFVLSVGAIYADIYQAFSNLPLR